MNDVTLLVLGLSILMNVLLLSCWRLAVARERQWKAVADCWRVWAQFDEYTRLAS